MTPMESSPALPSSAPSGQAQPAQPAQPEQAPLKAVFIGDNGDGTFTVQSSDDLSGSEDPEERSAELSESNAPLKSIDEALAKAKSILGGEASTDQSGQEMAGYSSAFPTDK